MFDSPTTKVWPGAGMVDWSGEKAGHAGQAAGPSSISGTVVLLIQHSHLYEHVRLATFWIDCT